MASTDIYRQYASLNASKLHTWPWTRYHQLRRKAGSFAYSSQRSKSQSSPGADLSNNGKAKPGQV